MRIFLIALFALMVFTDYAPARNHQPLKNLVQKIKNLRHK